MKILLFITLLTSFCSAIAVPLPDELTGIWASPSSEFRGDFLFKGDAIYLDSDGVGGHWQETGRTF
jgi:hypothetical protein